MSEYLLQVAAKLEISSEETAAWDINDICNVVQESLTQLYLKNDASDRDMIKHHILHFIEMMKQYPPTIHKEKVTSYFHRNGMKHWFYIGTVDDKGKAQKYDAVSLYYPGEDLTGTLDLDHGIKVPEGEFKVMGVAKFSSLTGMTHKIKKLTMPEDIKRMIAEKSTREVLLRHPETNKIKSKSSKKVHQIIKKPIQKKKQGGVSSFLKYIAPGAGSLLLAGQYNNPQYEVTTSGEEEEETMDIHGSHSIANRNESDV
ncbi:matrix protein [Strawberry virus 3]|nr:matrix protein [Strawberry virus 3]